METKNGRSETSETAPTVKQTRYFFAGAVDF